MDSPTTSPSRIRRRLGSILGIGAAAVLAAVGMVMSGGVAHAATQICNSNTTSNSGQFVSYWSNGSGSSCLTYSGSAYTATWSNIGDFTAGVGSNPGTSSGTISFSSNVTDSGGTALVSVYGWMTNPLVEYYVEENWSGSTNGSGTNLGTFSMNGATYTLWEHQQVNQPSINGTATFEQYIAVRSSPTGSSSVNMGTVTAAWRAAGLSVGTMNYQIVGSEAYGGGSGTINVNGGASTGGGGGNPTPTPTTSSGGGGGGGSCSASLSADGQGSNYYVLKVTVSGSSSWTVTMNMVAPAVVYATSGVNASWPSEYVMKATPGSGGNTFTVTISPNGQWTWPSVSCVT